MNETDGGRAEERKRGVRREHKSSLFVDLFSHDIRAEENLLSLYNALHGSELRPGECRVEMQTLGNAIYAGRENDVAALVDGRLLLLVEHQSTVNENMPLRMLEYLVGVYDRLAEPRSKFRRRRITVPFPEFHVLYNGTEDYPSEGEMRLSGMFADAGGEPSLELVVRVHNINLSKGLPILEKCPTLGEYEQVVELLRDAVRNGMRDPVGWTLAEARRLGLLQEYLGRKAREVNNMIFGEYSYEEDVATQREEAWGEGRSAGIAEGRDAKSSEIAVRMKADGLPVEQIARYTGLDAELVAAL